MKLLFALIPILFFISQAFPSVSFDIFNEGYAYNDEDANGDYQPQTIETITYFEDLFQPYFDIKASDNFDFKVGSGFLIPFNQSEKIWDYFPFIQSKFTLDNWKIIVGSLENDHDMAPFMLDPLDKILPDNRVLLTPDEDYYMQDGPGTNLENIDPTNTMGYYQYGGQIRYNDDHQNFDLYYNWQVQGTADFRERFDVGITYNYDIFYGAAHYWHNGGHEFQYGEEVTENYNIAFGLRNKIFSVIYTASEWLPNRDSLPSLDVFGQGLYAEYNYTIWGITITPQLFVSDSWFNTNDDYISVEGDPFYKCPFYFGLNFHYTIQVMTNVSLVLGLINGTYIPTINTAWEPSMTRYDQELDASMNYSFDVIK